MKFLKRTHNNTKYVDNIFSVTNMAKEDSLPEKVDGTAGCLRDEEGKLFTYRTVFNSERQLSDAEKAAYASSPAGNSDYISTISEYILGGRVSNHHGAIATPGGTGAIYTAMKLCLDDGDTIIYPEIAWGNYRLMAEEFNLKTLTYDIYDIDDLFSKIDSVERPFVIINSPCQNPCGHSYTLDEWKTILNRLNSLGKEAILLNDIAYIDYAYGDSRKFMELFNDISDDLLVLMAASCSKSFSYYGVRMGALIAINNDQEYVESFTNLASKLARTTWSNANNGAMKNIAKVLTDHYEEFAKEKDEAVEMMKKRTDLFIREADECGLEYYPFSEGFFVTLKFSDLKKRDSVHQKLIDNHIYTIKVNKGIRIGLCAMPLAKVGGLAKRIKAIMEETDMNENAKKELMERYSLSDEEVEEMYGGSGTNTSGDTPLFEVGQRVTFKMVTNPNSFAMTSFSYFDGEIVANLGKQGSYYPEFRYRIRMDDGFEAEIWEGEISAK